VFNVQEQADFTNSGINIDPGLNNALSLRGVRALVENSSNSKLRSEDKVNTNPGKSEMTQLLVSVSQKRDKSAFGYLYSYYAPRVKGYLIRQGADESSADELSQEALLSVWKKADRFDPSKASAGTWIFTVARNLMIDSIRKHKRPEFDPNDPAFIPDHEISPENSVEAKEKQNIVQIAMKSLPSDQAQVVHCSFYEDKAHGEIAEELGIPLGTVKSRLRLAMKKLSTLMGDKL